MVSQKPIRILHIVTYMNRGGLETMIMNVFRSIDREKVQFDFLVHRDFRADYDSEIESLGGRIYRIPRLNPFSPSYYRELSLFFREHSEYQIVHCHQDCLSAIPLAVAQKAGVPVRIAHSHTTSQDRDLKYLIKLHFKKKIPAVATHFFACSRKAGEWMFPGQNVVVVKNGIDVVQFSFSPEERVAVRKELGLRNELVLGHVGRFMPPKNHGFLIDVFKVVHERCPNAVLLLVGEGPLEAQVRKKVEKLGLTNAVRFLGLRTDVNRIYQAMDVFVMPSFYEGFGIAAIEAQTAGVWCVLADSIPAECMITERVKFCSLQAGTNEWADHILLGDTQKRRNGQIEVTAAGYDIEDTASWLQNFYLENWVHA